MRELVRNSLGALGSQPQCPRSGGTRDPGDGQVKREKYGGLSVPWRLDNPGVRLASDRELPRSSGGFWDSERSRAKINRALGRKSECDIFARDQVIESAANP
jgi:hypothetical protein